MKTSEITSLEDSSRSRQLQRIFVVLGIAALAGVAVWLLTGRGNQASSVSFASGLSGDPHLVPVDQLDTVPGKVDHPVFWAGDRPGTKVEVSDDASGNVHLRYLTGGAVAGDGDQTFLDIGTYPFQGAYRATKALANQPGVVKIRSGNGIGFYQKSRPYSVMLSYPSRPDLQIEVYHPKKNGALTIVRHGDIVPVP